MLCKGISPDLKGGVLQENDLNFSLWSSRLLSNLLEGWIQNISLNVGSHFALPKNRIQVFIPERGPKNCNIWEFLKEFSLIK